MMLNESSRDNLLQPYVDLYNEKMGGKDKATVSQMKQFLLRKFVNEALMRNLSLDSNYYLAGVARYYFHGDLTTNKVLNVFDKNVKDEFNQEICSRLNALILVLRNAYIDTVGQTFEQPEDFGTLSIAKLLRKYNKAINKELGIEVEKKNEPEKPTIDRDNRVGNGYTFEIIYNQPQVSKYNKYTEPGAWCITYAEHHYNSYVRSLHIHYVIFRKDGWENVERKKGPNFSFDNPRDEYGNSLIALLQSNVNGEPIYITSRWNHGSGEDNSRCEADHAYTKQQFMDITGVTDADLQRIFSIWKEDVGKKKVNSEDRKKMNTEKTTVLRALKYAQMRINQGMDLVSAFGDFAKDLNLYVVLPTDRYKELEVSNEGGVNDKALMKFKKNTILGGRIEYNDMDYGFIIDRGSIKFDTLTQEDFNIGEYYFEKADNANLIIIGGHGSDAKKMFYDINKHKLLEVDGVKTFKRCSFTPRYNYDTKISYYVIGKNLNTWAMLDAKTNEPLKLPNGSYWFETATEYGQVRWSMRDPIYAISNAGTVVTIVYDSASNENYYYNINVKKFIELGQNEQLSNIAFGRGYGVYAITRSDSWGGVSGMQFFKDGEPYDKLPGHYNYNSYINYEHTTTCPPFNRYLVLEQTQNNRLLIFDLEEEQFINLPPFEIGYTGHITVCTLNTIQNRASDGGLHDDILLIKLNSHWERRIYSKGGYNANSTLMFSINKRKWLRNPVNNTFIFPNFSQKWSSDRSFFNETQYCYDGYFWLGNRSGYSTDAYYLNADGEFVQGEYSKAQEVDEGKVYFTNNDIKAMVLECIRRITRKSDEENGFI